MTREQHQAIGRANGRKAAITNMKNKTSIFAPENKGKGGRANLGISKGQSPHVRWHVKRHIVKQDCRWCMENHNG